MVSTNGFFSMLAFPTKQCCNRMMFSAANKSRRSKDWELMRTRPTTEKTENNLLTRTREMRGTNLPCWVWEARTSDVISGSNSRYNCPGDNREPPHFNKSVNVCDNHLSSSSWKDEMACNTLLKPIMVSTFFCLTKNLHFHCIENYVFVANWRFLSNIWDRWKVLLGDPCRMCFAAYRHERHGSKNRYDSWCDYSVWHKIR